MGSNSPPRSRPVRFGERALLLRLEDQAQVHAIAAWLLEDLRAGRVEDVVPADRSLLVRFDGTDAGERAARRALADAIARSSGDSPRAVGSRSRHREIPVAYGGVHGPDLAETAELAGIPPDALIDFHAGREHTVLFLGFAPGFAYMGQVASEIVVPRLGTPRTETPAGSVALAESYTSVYPSRLPGGWRVIGWTPVRFFDPTADPPTYLLPGDTVRFRPVRAEDLPPAQSRPADWAG